MRKTLFILFLGVSICIQAQNSYHMAGPYEVIARDGEFRYTKVGSEHDMRAALTFAKEGQTEKALKIINAYANTLQRIEGHDAPLCSIQCFDLVRAMIMLRNHQSPQWKAMIERVMIPMMRQFEADSPYANGNWGAIVNRLRMACGIFLQDSTIYRTAINYHLNAYDNGALPHYISETGQCQESGRDQSHVQLGLEALAQTCEMAYEQGDDLWGALENRLLKGFEYTAKYNLGYEVPFSVWNDCTGLYCEWTTPSEMGRGKLWDIYRLPYQHYVGRMGLKMPYTERIVKGEKTKVKEAKQLHQVFTYTAPKGAPLMHDYKVYIQPRGTDQWIQIDTYMAKVNATLPQSSSETCKTGHKVSKISYAMFDFIGDVFVRVVCSGKTFHKVGIRPNYKGVIANILNDSTIQFLLFQPENVSVEFDDRTDNNLLLFTSAPPQSMADAKKVAKQHKRTFKYYAPGLYNEKNIQVKSNTTLYLAGGSYFTGTFAIEDAENVSIIGRGIARPEDGYEGCHIHRSKNVLIDGMVLNTCPIGGSDGVRIHDVRSISHPSWGDGLNVFASENIEYDRVFCRNSDDCTTAYATRKGFSGNTRHIRMKNSTLWADVAHPIFIGIHGNSERGDTIENLFYENIDILGQSEPQIDYQGCLSINCGDNNIVRKVLFNNIRIEQILQGSLFQVKVGFNQKYCTAPGRSIEDITFRRISYKGSTPNLSIINGYDADRKVKNIRFEGLKINGKTIYDSMLSKPAWYSTSDYIPAFIGNHVEGLQFVERKP